MRISVVVPLYNGEKYIGRALDSIRGQTHKDIETVVVDDGSTDGGASVVTCYKGIDIKLVRKRNAGAGSARNRGITEASSEYVAFLDADDEWDPDFLAAVLSLKEEYPKAGIFGTGYRVVCPEGPTMEITIPEARRRATFLVLDYFRRCKGGQIINSSGVMIAKETLSRLGTFQEGVAHGEDLEMWARIALHYPIAYDGRILFSYHQTGFDSKPRQATSPLIDPMLRLLDGEAVSETDPSLQRDLSVYRKLYLRQSLRWFLQFGDRASAIRYFDANLAWDALWPPLKVVSSKNGWRILRAFSLVSRFRRSRLALQMRGGMASSNGVLKRIGRKWSAEPGYPGKPPRSRIRIDGANH